MIAAPNSVVFYFVLFSVVMCVLDIILNHQQDKTSRIPVDYLWSDSVCVKVLHLVILYSVMFYLSALLSLICTNNTNKMSDEKSSLSKA